MNPTKDGDTNKLPTPMQNPSKRVDKNALEFAPVRVGLVSIRPSASSITGRLENRYYQVATHDRIYSTNSIGWFAEACTTFASLTSMDGAVISSRDALFTSDSKSTYAVSTAAGETSFAEPTLAWVCV